MAGALVRTLVHKLVSCPEAMFKQSTDFILQSKDVNCPSNSGVKMPTSVDGQSTGSPFLSKLADLPVAPTVKAHSIIAIKGEDHPPAGGDGVVKYTSAHLDGVESEFIVNCGHSCQDQLPTIEEVRRILHEHLKPCRPRRYRCVSRPLENPSQSCSKTAAKHRVAASGRRIIQGRVEVVMPNATSLHLHRDVLAAPKLLHITDRVSPEVENARGQHGVGFARE